MEDKIKARIALLEQAIEQEVKSYQQYTQQQQLIQTRITQMQGALIEFRALLEDIASTHTQ